MTEIIYSELLDELTYKDLGAILAAFADSKPLKSNNESHKTDAYIPIKYAIQINFI